MNDPASLSMAERIDSLCDRFESEWSGRSPRIEEQLSQVSDAERPELLRALLLVELELLAREGRTGFPSEYLQRFPHDAESVEAAFAEFAQLSGPSSVKTVTVTGAASDTSVRVPGVAPSDTPVPATFGRFEVLSVLGQGAFGTVYKARDPKLDRIVAVKVPRKNAMNPEDRARFLREARAAGQLSHPSICPVFEVDEIDGRDYIVMAFVDGKPLSKVIETGKVHVKQAVSAVRRIATALEEAHTRGIIHRDLKPANILVNSRGEPTVMDFGLARSSRPGDAQITRSGMIMGSPAYMSPEQARGDSGSVGPASDVYSLGVVLYELLTGTRPFEGSVTEVLGQILHVEPEPPSRRRPSLDPGLEAICLKAMAKDQSVRYRSMREFAQALARWQKRESPEAIPSAAKTTIAQPAPQSEETHPTETQRIANVLAEFSSEQRSQTEAAVARALHRHFPRWAWLATGLGLAVLTVVLGIVFFVRKETFTVVVQIPIDNLKDPSLTFLLDNNEVTGEQLSVAMELKPGDHELLVHRDGKLFRRFTIFVGAKQTDPVIAKEVVIEPPPPAPPLPPQKNYVLQFDGTEQSIGRAPGFPEYDGGPVTVEVRIRVEQDTDGSVFHWPGKNSVSLYRGRDGWGFSRFLGRKGGDRTQGLRRDPKGRRIHVAGVWDGKEARLYVGGLRLNGPWIESERDVAPEPVRIGSTLNAGIDELRISRGARYIEPFEPERRFEPDEQTIALYHFDEGTGDVAKDAASKAPDIRLSNVRWITWEPPAASGGDPTPIGHWTFDDPQNLGRDVAADPASSEIVGKVTAAAGVLGHAADLSGKGYFRIAPVAKFNLTRQATLAGWSKWTGTSDEGGSRIVGKTRNKENWSIWTGRTKAGGELQFPIVGASPASVGFLVTVQPNVWNHTAITFDGKGVSYYLNGKKIQTIPLAESTEIAQALARTGGNAFPDSILEIAAPVVIGSTVRTFDGLVDDVRIYDVPLTEEQIARLATPPTSAKDNGEGWTDLFNGKDLTGWKWGEPDKPNPWTVDAAEQTLVCAGTGPGPGRILWAEGEYSDFVFRGEFRLAPQSSGGVALHGIAEPGFRRLEIKVADDAERPTGSLLFSAQQAVNAQTPPRLPPPDQWNTIEIEASGPKIRVLVNGTPVGSYDTSQVEITSRQPVGRQLAETNLRRTAGLVGLSAQKNEIRWRRLQIRKLEAAAQTAPKAAINPDGRAAFAR